LQTSTSRPNIPAAKSAAFLSITQDTHHPHLKMANYLASIFGTEADKVNCSFYYKIGACRHGDRCSRKHVKPSYSQTILLPNLYQNPAYDPKNKMNASQLQNHFDAFYEDFWCEMCKFGEIEEVVVCDNNNDRMLPFPSSC
jgi:splicing factor U2AF subunit